jgi:hypothetical protein
MSNTIEIDETTVVVPVSEEKGALQKGLYWFMKQPALNLPVRTPKDKLGFEPKGTRNQTRKEWNAIHPGKWLTVGPNEDMNTTSKTLVRAKDKGEPNTNDMDSENKENTLSNVIDHGFIKARRMRRASQ